MPQLVKGGKYIFGWSKVGKEGKIRIPPEAYEEYNLKKDIYAILFSGSKTSGGFGLSSVRILKNSVMKDVLEQNNKLAKYKIAEGEVVQFKNRKYAWVEIREDGIIYLPKNTLEAFKINYNDLLLSGRGSYLAIGFIAKGPIFNEAIKHPELQVF
ncbi:MAG: hypothetical protein ACFFFT_00510 [Candidatus Thorarchaeota archaeon]